MNEQRELAGRPVAGFTLIELMIVVAIVAILAAIAYPNFIESVRKGRRSDAMAALTSVQHAQERFRANNASYSDTLAATGLNLPAASPEGHYAVALSSVTAAGYTATATAASGSPQSDDSKCRVFRIVLNDLNGLIQRNSTNSAGTTNSSANNPCWIK